MPTPTPAPGILEIDPYVAGRSDAPGATRVYKLSSNESPLGPSPRAVEAFRRSAEQLSFYPDRSASVLRDAIAETFGLNPDGIVCGNGSDELLHLIPACYCSEGDEVLFTKHAFAVYPIAALAASATPVIVPETDLTASVDALIAGLTPRTKVVFIANPNNPTGTYLSAAEMRRLHAALRPETILVIDAAYGEFVQRDDYDMGLEMVAASDNVVVTRTLSKAYGLAGLRIGWAYCPPGIAEVLNRTRAPFNVSIPAQEAGAAAIRDAEFTAKVVAHNARWQPWLEQEIVRLGYRITPGVGNFVLVHFDETPGRSVREADAFLLSRGLIVRGVANYHLPNALRISVGTEEANRLLVQALADFRAGWA